MDKKNGDLKVRVEAIETHLKDFKKEMKMLSKTLDKHLKLVSEKVKEIEKHNSRTTEDLIVDIDCIGCPDEEIEEIEPTPELKAIFAMARDAMEKEYYGNSSE